MPSDARDNSSVAMQLAMYSPSPPSLKPPYSEGTESPNAPSSARPEMISSGTSALWRCTCSACGAITFVAKLRKVSCTISNSSSRWRGPAVKASAAKNSGSRNVVMKSCTSARGFFSTPHISSRPRSRALTSCNMSATNAQVMSASMFPLLP